MKKSKVISLVLFLVLALTLISSAHAFGPPGQKENIPGRLIAELDADIPACYRGYISSGMVPCGSPPGTTPQHKDVVWPKTICTLDFSLSADAWIGLEIHRVYDDTYTGRLGVGLNHWDEKNGKWVNVDVWSTAGTGTHENWISTIKFDRNTRFSPAGKYQIVAWGEVVYFQEAVYGYNPSKGSIKVYAFMPIDSDGDGVFNHVDWCPSTSAGVAVDERGCPTIPDSDGD